MNETTLTLLNSSVVTSYGTFTYQPLSLDGAKALVQEFRQTGKATQSAIGHQPTAEFLSALLDFPVVTNRIEFKQTSNDVALIFKLKQRLPDRQILSCEEMEAVGYEFGILRKIA
jgi:Domain of unknown function (DUF1874)